MHSSHACVKELSFSHYQLNAAYYDGALHGFPDTVASLRKMGCTLKPGAPVVVLTFLNCDQALVRMRRKAEARNDKLVKLHLFAVADQADS